MRKHCSNVCKLRPCLATESTKSARMRTIVTAALQRQYSQTELTFWIRYVHTYINTYIHTYMHTYIHKHTRIIVTLQVMCRDKLNYISYLGRYVACFSLHKLGFDHRAICVEFVVTKRVLERDLSMTPVFPCQYFYTKTPQP